MRSILLSSTQEAASYQRKPQMENPCLHCLFDKEFLNTTNKKLKLLQRAKDATRSNTLLDI